MEQPTLFAEDILASHSVAPGSDKARKMTVTSGQRCLLASGNTCPLGSLEKTLLGTLAWGSTLCFLTWKVKATPHGRLLFQLAPLMPDTEGTEFGLSPTPRVVEIVEHPKKQAERLKDRTGEKPNNLQSMARYNLWPTPQASDNRDRGSLSSGAVQRRREKGKQISLSQSVSDVSGQLNPQWVEWLMGFPEGWTDLGHSETP